MSGELEIPDSAMMAGARAFDLLPDDQECLPTVDWILNAAGPIIVAAELRSWGNESSCGTCTADFLHRADELDLQ